MSLYRASLPPLSPTFTTLSSPSSVFYLPTFIPDSPPSLPFAPTPPRWSCGRGQAAPFSFPPLCVLASLALAWVYMCVSVCVSLKHAKGMVHVYIDFVLLDTVPPCDCETRLWHVAGGVSGRRPGAGPFPTRGCRTTSVCTHTRLCPFRGQNLIFLLVPSSEPSRESLRISLSMKVPTMDGVSEQWRGSVTWMRRPRREGF